MIESHDLGLTRTDDHRYYYRGRELAGVTRTLEVLGLIDDRWFTEASRDRGSDIHDLAGDVVRSVFLGERSYVIVPPDFDGYLHALLAFWRDYLLVLDGPLFVETMLMDVARGAAGTVDIAGLVRSSLENTVTRAVIDYKTGPFYPWHRLQLSAYRALLKRRTGLPYERWHVQLHSTGTYHRLVLDHDALDEAAWYGGLTLANWKGVQHGD